MTVLNRVFPKTSGKAFQSRDWINKKWGAILVLGLLVLGTFFLLFGYQNAYQLLGVPVFQQTFLDLQLITGSADSLEDGFDPGVANPGDPRQRIFNYPKIWYAFLRLGLGKGATLPLGIASLGLFFCSLALFPHSGDRFTLTLLTLVTFSSALMLAYERANVDLLFFSAMVIALLMVERFPLGSLAVMILSILFKIFPVFACGLYLDKQKSQSIWKVLLLIGLTLLYFSLTWEDMRHIFATTERGTDTSYGLQVAVDFLLKKQGLDFPALKQLAYGLAALLGLTALWGGCKSRSGLATVETEELRAFWAGAGIYLGTFWLGNNWDYRLMFLILTLPALAVFVRRNLGPVKGIAHLTLGALLLSVWYLFIQRWFGQTTSAYNFFYWLDELANWTLYFGLAWLFSSGLPAWLWPVEKQS